MFSRLAIETILDCVAKSQAMERAAVKDGDVLHHGVKSMRDPASDETSSSTRVSRHNRGHRIPAPPPHVLGSSRDTYYANVLTACGFSHNDSQHFREFTVEGQSQWIELLEKYQDKRYQNFTPAYEEVPEILEKLRSVITGQSAGSQSKEKRRKQSEDVTNSRISSTVLRTEKQSCHREEPRRPKQPSDHVMSLPKSRQAFQYPDSMKHLPRLTFQSFRQQIRDQKLEGVFVESVPLASLADKHPGQRFKEQLEKHGMADYVKWGRVGCIGLTLDLNRDQTRSI